MNNLNADMVDGKDSTEFISGYEMVEDETAFDSTDVKFKAVNCPNGKEVLGGSGSILNSQGSVGHVIVYRDEANANPSGWYAEATEIDTGTTDPWTLRVRVICADAQQ